MLWPNLLWYTRGWADSRSKLSRPRLGTGLLVESWLNKTSGDSLRIHRTLAPMQHEKWNESIIILPSFTTIVNVLATRENTQHPWRPRPLRGPNCFTASTYLYIYSRHINHHRHPMVFRRFIWLLLFCVCNSHFNLHLHTCMSLARRGV